MARTALIATGLACSIGAAALAQPATDDEQAMRYQAPLITGVPPGFQRIDQGAQDLNALQTSLRSSATSVDLRTPTDFKEVYKGPDGRFYRFDGAIGASFPNSEYYINRKGNLEILVPGGTQFFIGTPWSLAGPKELLPLANPNRTSAATGNQTTNSTLASAGNQISSRGAEGEVHVLVTALPPELAGETPTSRTIIGDAAYRKDRLAALLREASEHPAPADDAP